MSTPVDPQRSTADPSPTTRWSDAQVQEGRDGHSNTTRLPPVHADGADRARGDRQPQVDVRDGGTAPTGAAAGSRVGAAADRLDPDHDRDQHDRDHDRDRYDRAGIVDRERDRSADLGDRGVDHHSDQRAQPAVVGATDRQSVVAREKDRFGGMKFGSAFFGWLTATGLAVLLLAILAAAGVAFGVATANNVNTAVQQSQNATGTAKTVGLVGAIVLLVILFVAYYCGGYVAGRMARFDGMKQGLGVWIWAIITSAIIAGVAAIAGSKYNVLAQLNLPRIPVDEGSVTTVGIIAIVAAIVVALLGALLGGAIGTRYHRKVDAVGFDDVRN